MPSPQQGVDAGRRLGVPAVYDSRIVESLHHAGIFYMKGAVSEVAAQLGSSEATIYRYLSKLK